MSATTQVECPTGPQGQHDRYSDGTCAYCRTTLQAQATSSQFRQGEALAYRRTLALLDALAEQEASSSRDKGRGVAHGAREIRAAVYALAEDAGISGEV